jgi:hypothetical protein
MAAKKDDMEPLDPMNVLERLTAALENLTAQRQGDGGANDRIEALIGTLATALARVSETQLEGAKLVADETRRAARPSNQVAPGRSVFHRRGVKDFKDWKPQLKCIMMVPYLLEWEQLTREEVLLYNLLQPGSYIVQRIDKSKVKVDVRIDYAVDDVTPSRLIMTHDTAFNNDNKNLIPATSDMLRFILKQHDPETAAAAREVMTDEEEEALIEAEQLSVSA